MNRIQAFLNDIRGDKVIWIVVLFLSIFSMLAVYSSTGTLAYRFQHGNTEYYILKHLFILFLGFALMYACHRIKYTYYARIAEVFYWGSVGLLIYTLIFGINLNEANRWATIPVLNVSFQSSDVAKLALIILIAKMLTKKQSSILNFKETFLPLLIRIGIIVALILPNNLSTAGLIFMTCIMLIYVGGVKIKYLVYLSSAGLLGFLMFVMVVHFLPNNNKGRIGTWQNRIETFIGGKGSDSFQSDQAKIAISTGGILGKMPGNGTQKNFLPHPYSDFIFAIIIEEYGLAGGFCILVLYVILFTRGYRIVMKFPHTFGALLAIGLSFSLTFQALINMLVAVDLMPVTGQPLPLVSMGGTSIWFTCISIGIILSVSRYIEEHSDEEINSEPSNDYASA
ncbi:MAG: FtsW/RodA/SpoVE family cell cycle protein [Bacteroidota bacterium]|nr:FtsW/RodA/SpoVE family cell cycle protein [Bacteroidota bacterium]